MTGKDIVGLEREIVRLRSVVDDLSKESGTAVKQLEAQVLELQQKVEELDTRLADMGH